MTEQEKLDKIIRAIECRLDVGGSKYKHCLTCDYRHDIDHCQWACQTDGILEDALALLKAQEPRVMTVADIVDNYVAPEVVWVEARNNKGDIRLVAGLWNGEYYNMADDSVMYDLGEEIANNPEGYNTRWRCWTSRPTAEQREATPWNN